MPKGKQQLRSTKAKEYERNIKKPVRDPAGRVSDRDRANFWN